MAQSLRRPGFLLCAAACVLLRAPAADANPLPFPVGVHRTVLFFEQPGPALRILDDVAAAGVREIRLSVGARSSVPRVIEHVRRCDELGLRVMLMTTLAGNEELQRDAEPERRAVPEGRGGGPATRRSGSRRWPPRSSAASSRSCWGSSKRRSS